VKWLKKKGYKLDVIRKGTILSVLSTGFITFHDCLNFTTSCSLATFIAMWGSGQEMKSIWPYELYTNINEIKEAQIFPSIRDFRSTLKRPKNVEKVKLENALSRMVFALDIDENELARLTDISPESFRILGDGSVGIDSDVVIDANVDIEDYAIAYIQFNEQKLGNNDFNMLDYLKRYNTADTKLLLDAMDNYHSEMFVAFDARPLDFVGIPGKSSKKT